MPPKPRQMKVDQKSSLGAMQRLETRSNDELASETKYRSAAQALLGARAAERYDAPRAREHFRAAIAAARPQERLQLRRMAEASLALAERRPADLKAAAERMGQTPPTNRQLLLLRFMGLIAPPANAGALARVRGVLILVLMVVVLLAIGWGLVQLVSLPFGGIGAGISIFWGFLLVVVALVVLAFVGRRRQATARAKALSGGPGGSTAASKAPAARKPKSKPKR